MPRVATTLLGASLLLGVSSASAGEDDADAEVDAGANVDAASPGPLVRSDLLRPPDAAGSARACSLRRPVCIHGARDVSPADVLATLSAAERAWDASVGALDLPAPDADPGTGAYDVYLALRPPLPARTVLSERDARGPVDRASAFTVLDARLVGCSRERVVARELLRAILFRVSPAMDEGSARAQTSALAELVAPCAVVDDALFQSHPERAFVDTWPEAPADVGARFDDGAGLVYRWLDETFAAEPGGVIRALWALSPSKTPAAAWRWTNEPDSFEVLRASFKEAISTGSTIDDLEREISVARAGVRGTDVKVDWAIDWPKAPRRLSSPQAGVAPTGSSFVALRRGDAPPGTRLRIEMEWETHAKMRWAIVKLDAAGRPLGHLPVPTTDRATSVQMSLVDLDAAATVLVVATNCGDATYPFDPDDEVWEPHGWLLTVARE